MRHTLVIIALMLAMTITARAQDDENMPVLRSVTSSYTIETGNAHIADTYLTPLHYRGRHYSVQYERGQAMRFAPNDWTMQLKLGAVFDDTDNPSKNATMLNAAVEGSWTMMRRWQLPASITVGVGPGTSLDLGILYLSRNGNNPASVKFGWTFDADAFISWRVKVWKLPMTLRYQATLPLTGVFFSPDYGQLYYQIYMGDTSNLAHAAWPGNYFNLDNLLTADLHFGCTSLRIGYHNHIFSSKVNHIVSQDITHAIVIGVTTEWISLRPDSRSIDARIISSY